MPCTRLQLNEGPWKDWIESQSPLFNVNCLDEISTRFREGFRDDRYLHKPMPHIRGSTIAAPVLKPLLEKTSGYDLPCLISSPTSSKGTVMFCAQDPLRRGVNEGLTVAMFFGFESWRIRQSRRHYGMVWRLVKRCLDEGYSVWLTDAIKLYVRDERLSDDLNELCVNVLSKEIEKVQPAKIVAFGNRAHSTLLDLGCAPIIRHVRHPAARYTRQWVLEGVPDGCVYENSAEGRLRARVDRYWRDIWRQDG